MSAVFADVIPKSRIKQSHGGETPIGLVIEVDPSRQVQMRISRRPLFEQHLVSTILVAGIPEISLIEDGLTQLECSQPERLLRGLQQCDTEPPQAVRAGRVWAVPGDAIDDQR